MVIPLQVKTVYIFFSLIHWICWMSAISSFMTTSHNRCSPRPPLDGEKFCRFQVLPSPLGSSGWKSLFSIHHKCVKIVCKYLYCTSDRMNSVLLPTFHLPTFTIENTKCRYIYHTLILWDYLVKEKPSIQNVEPLKKISWDDDPNVVIPKQFSIIQRRSPILRHPIFPWPLYDQLEIFGCSYLPLF